MKNIFVALFLISLVSCQEKMDGFEENYVKCVNESVTSLLLEEKNANYGVFKVIDSTIRELDTRYGIDDEALKIAVKELDAITYDKYREVINKDFIYSEMMNRFGMFDQLQNSCIRMSYQEKKSQLTPDFIAKLNILLKIEQNLIELEKVNFSDLDKLKLALDQNDKLECSIYYHFLFLIMERSMSPQASSQQPELKLEFNGEE